MWTSLPLASSSSAVGLISGSCPSARVFAPRFLQTPSRDGSPCASLSLLLHQDVKRTSTSKLSFMRGVPTTKPLSNAEGLLFVHIRLRSQPHPSPGYSEEPRQVPSRRLRLCQWNANSDR